MAKKETGETEQIGKHNFINRLVTGKNGTVKGEIKCVEGMNLVFPRPSNHLGKDGPALGGFGCCFHTQTMKYSGSLSNCTSAAN